ncbi:related to ATP-dependent DNA helicase II, 70 kDa subunit [Melanopsichium pennsylvanicum]|uniref:ATP-dependent DNA helicase II subunit 1 n=2 Tax=Melanopsichium pennsylvanicum TaxID=63383 RepID=A0AAJ5C5I2_9BASI|nr:related to ATP-dependent DNA helicase II, 70 kDa subunit [Melanopsichium pennsylvanicum 4]SNX84766.1 related to ATP-dependent DNA helicase II, 70 kDa subunit [Melanopsichium pennsylvanicum]
MPKAYFVDKREAARAFATDSESEDELETLDLEATYQKDMVLFCIDAGPSMHRIDPKTNTSPLCSALKAASSLMQNKLISSPHDHVGVLIFNCAETLFRSAKPGEYYKGSYELQSLRQVNVPDTYNLKALLHEAESHPKHLQDVLPPAEKQMRVDWALANAGVVMVAAANAGSKRIFWITDNDDPHPIAQHKATKVRRACLDKMNEFRKIGVRILPFFIKPAGEAEQGMEFEINKFYADVFAQYDDDLEDEDSAYPQKLAEGIGRTAHVQLKGQELKRSLWDSAIHFQELEDDIATRETPKRVVFNIRYELAALDPPASPEEAENERLPQARTRGRKWQIGIKGYSLVSKTTKGNPVKVIVDDECGELKEVVTHQHYIDANSGKPLSKDQVIPAFQFGQSSTLRGQVTFTPEELRRVKTFGMLPALKLIGFRNRDDLLKFEWNVKHAYFIYPSDAEWKGSRKTFSALLNSMVKKNKVGLGLFMPRQNVVPVFVAIVPQEEEIGQDGQQMVAPGMNIVTLPYADDVRDVPTNLLHTEDAKDDQIDKAIAFIERYQKKQPFNPDHYPNPALNHHYEVLMATAFQESLPESPTDLTVPQYATIKKRTAHLIQEWHSAINEDPRVAMALGLGSNKVAKTSSNVRKSSFEDDTEILDLWGKGKLSAYTVEELKGVCDFYRLDKKGKKADLLVRIDAHIRKRREG